MWRSVMYSLEAIHLKPYVVHVQIQWLVFPSRRRKKHPSLSVETPRDTLLLKRRGCELHRQAQGEFDLAILVRRLMMVVSIPRREPWYPNRHVAVTRQIGR